MLSSIRPGDWGSPSAAGIGAVMAVITPMATELGVMILTRVPISTRAFWASASWRSSEATARLPDTDTIWARRTGGAAGRPRRSRNGGAG